MLDASAGKSWCRNWCLHQNLELIGGSGFAALGRNEACIYAADKLFAIGKPVAQHEFQHALRGRFCGRSKRLQALLIRRRQGELRGSLTC